MKHPLFFILGAAILIGNFSCKKPEPDPVNDPPVFYFRGNVGTSAFNLQAGINNYYMSSSFNQDANNVYSFSGNLGVYNCTTCGNALQVKLNDFQTSSLNGNAAIGTSLSGVYYPYMTPGGTPTSYYVTFSSANQGIPQHYSWDFGDGTTMLDTPSPVHVYARPGVYRVTHVVTFQNNHSDTTAYNIRFGIPEAGLDGGFSPYAVAETLSFYNSIGGGTQPYSYYWDLGDGTISTASVPPPTHTYANAGVYKVYMRVTDAAGRILESQRNVATQYYTPSYGEGFYATAVAVPNQEAFSNVTITWKDASGDTYTSNNAAQPSGSYFKLISVDDYQNNANGERTKKIHVNFKCKVYSNASGDSLQIDNGDAVIAVAYQ